MLSEQVMSSVFLSPDLFSRSTRVILLLFAFTCISFTDGEHSSSFIYATIDGKAFQFRDDQLYRGVVTNKNGSLDGRAPSRTVITTTFNGLSYNAAEGRLFNEAVQFELGYEPEVTGDLKYYGVAVQYLSANYFMLKDYSKLRVTAFEWESDKKHFLISAEYDCKMRSWGYPTDGKEDVNLKGKFTNIRITVPSWLNAKN